jgi:SAM-dependent methyltransferase
VFVSHYRRFFEQLNTSPPPADDIRDEFPWTALAIPPEVRTILDVGCGRGEFLRQLGPEYWTVGVDLVRPAPGSGGRFVQASVDALPFADRAFDLVACFEVLEQLPWGSYERALDELQRVAAQHLVISVPNREVLAEGLVVCRRCACAFHPSWHVRSFDPQTLGTLFPRFTLLDCRAVGPMVRYGETWIARPAVVGAHRMPSAVSVCPQCGHTLHPRAAASDLPGNDKRTGPETLLRRALWRLLFRRSRPYWLLATYRRRHEGLRTP